MEIKCNKCESVDFYRVIMKSGQKTAWCNNCDSFIKNIPYAEPTIYFGKYKGMKIVDMKTEEQKEYLEWMLDNVKISNAMAEAIEIQLEK